MADTLEQALLEVSFLDALSDEDKESLIIVPSLRTIVVPSNFFFGVYNDKDVLSVPFIIPRHYDNVDLADFTIQINYLNSVGYGNVYEVTDASADDDYIRFNWLVGRGVFVKEGEVQFIVCMRLLGEDGAIEKEFNTTIAKADVLKGLEVEDNPDPEAYSILANMKAIEASVIEYQNRASEEADRLVTVAENMETALKAFVGSPLTAATVSDMSDITKVYVYTGNESGYTFGKWYYYNGLEWTEGGEYNSTVYQTDTSLTEEGIPADAKTVGDTLALKVDGARLTDDGLLYLTIGGVDAVGPLGPFASGGTEVVTTLPAEPDPDVSYILKSSDGLILYRYEDDTWRVVGSSAAIIAQSLPPRGNPLADYFIKNENDVYLHYRYINGQYEQIGSDSYSKEEIDDALDDIASMSVTDISESSSGIRVTFGDGSTKNVSTKDTTVVVEDGEALEGNAGIRLLYTDGSSKDIAISGGGGGTSAGSASITRVTPAASQCVSGEPFTIEYQFNAFDSAGDRVGSGVATWYVGNVRRATSVAQQEVTNRFEIGQYLTVGSNSIKVSISIDTGAETPTIATKTWTINVISLYAIWDYEDSTINQTDSVTLRWTPYGDLEKVSHFVIDGVERTDLETSTSRSGVQQTVTLDRLAHGSHMVELYLTATVNNSTIRSASLYHDMIFIEDGNDTPVISCSLTTTSITQYNTLRIPWVVYDPTGITTTVILSENGVEVATLENIGRTLQSWVYTPISAGEKTLTITCGETTKTLTLTVIALDIDNEEVGGYSFRLKASDLVSNNTLRNWSSNGITATFSNNFDWTNGGLKTEVDEDGNLRQMIVIKAGTRMTINHKLFGDDPTILGKTFKVIFKITNCRDYDADILSCYYGGVGVQLSAHEGLMSSTNTSISVPYGEDEYIELEFDIYPTPTATNGSFRYMMAWIDGVITTCRVYGASDNFTQPNANQQDIVIGSDDCDVCIYMVKSYPVYMTRENHIVNFISDAPNAQEMVKRYERNDIIDASGEIDYQKLAVNNPDCRVWLYDIPYLTVGKKDKVKNCIFNQLWRNGDQYFELSGVGTMTVQGTSSVDYIRGAANTDISFTALTDGYGNDLLENGVVDEDHYGKNYFLGDPLTGEVTVFTASGQEDLGPECIAIERNSSGEVTKYIKALGYKINETSTPITYSNTKVNFASCEQVNNMCNAIWYQRFNPYPSLTPRDCMEFSMGVQFIKDSGTLPDTDHFVLFGDNKYHMYSIANMGTSKKNVHVFHDLSNQNDCCIEVNNNLDDLCRMVTDDMSNHDWTGKIEGKDHSYGMRYPDVDEPSDEIKSGWQRFVSWMASRNPNAATNSLLSTPETYGNYTFRGHDREGTQVLRGTSVTAYAGTYNRDTFERRMARMLSECEDYLVMDSVVYHFVYLERHTMVDNVSKNSFWSSTDLLHWDLSKAYDMDTSDGNNNEGQMVFDYGYEANDVIGTKTVFNANDAVWFVFVSNLYEACQTMFTNRETAGAWSATAYHDFLLTEQKKVPERVWIECYWRDYLRTYEQAINDSWMTFLDGGQKTHQRWHYEYYEEIYDSSKYRGTSCLVQNINFRGYYPSRWDGLTDAQWNALKPKAEVILKMYNKCYINVSIDGTIYRQKADRGEYYTIDFSNQSKLNDTVINIYSAQMIQELGDISRLYPGTPNFSNASRIRSLTVGSPTSGYQNSNLTSITFGNNKMLEYLYLQNLAYVTSNLTLDNCQALLYVDASGSSFTGYEFADGGLLTTVYAERPTALIMRNLHYLTDANFHVASYEGLNTLTIENCEGINSKAIVTAAENLATVRLLNIDWVLDETTLLNRLLTLQGRDDSGYVTTQSVLTGAAYVSGSIRNQEILEYSNAWPNLDVTYDASHLVAQFLVQYVNIDRTLLYQVYVDRGSYPPDPYALGYIEKPTMETTDQYVYEFSGWDDLESAVIFAKTITAVYTTTLKRYTVSWYPRPGANPYYQIECDYGDEALWPGEDLPTDTSEESGYVVNSFAGWDKSTGYIRGDMDVYAIWERSGLPSTSKDLKDMTRAEINAVMTFGLANDYCELKDYFNMDIGFDPTFTNVESQVILQNRFFDGSQSYDTNIKLFDADAPTFTLAIDFEFLRDGENNGSLVSCYDEDGNEGFRLRWQSSDNTPTIQWGDKTITAGYQDQRNVVVLRHIAGSNSLYVYTFNTGAGRYNTSIVGAELIRSRDTSSDNTLCFGAVRFTADGGHDYYAKGWIHWCKIWYDDLGNTVTRKIVSWPHETFKMEFVGADLYRRAGSTSIKANGCFMSNPALTLYSPPVNTTNTNEGGWRDSSLRTFFNTRFWESLDYGWQSIIKKVKVLASAGKGSTEILTSEDNIFLPSCIEVSTGYTSTNYYPTYVNEGEHLDMFTSNRSRYKFPGLALADDAQIIDSATDPTMLLDYTVNEGDIWVYNPNAYTSDSNCDKFYYLPKEKAEKHTRFGPYANTSTSYCKEASDGGIWVHSIAWLTRSPYNYQYQRSDGTMYYASSNDYCYVYIYDRGFVSNTSANSTSIGSTFMFCI